MGIEFIKYPELSKLTTLGFGGAAELMAVVRDPGDLDELSEFLMTTNLRPLVIGRGSNLLAREESTDLLLIKVESPITPDRVESDATTLTLRAGAGLKFPALLGWAKKAGLSGLENLTGIPGTVGGAVAMNAGSYGTEFGSLLTRIQLWSPTDGVFWKNAEDCGWGYRHFDPRVNMGKALVLNVEMTLRISSTDKVAAAMSHIYDKKKATQPVTARTAGCVFKNPEGHSAGKLLDDAGFKGKTLGNVGFSPMHANFLENLGGGTASEALELMDMAVQSVKERFGVVLEREVIVV